MEYKYNSWPLGKLPKEFQRQEPDKIKELGYNWNDPREIVDIFEEKVSKYAGSRYAVSCDCCSHGIFLSLQYLKSIGELKNNDIITIPNRTYVSVPMQIIHCGLKVEVEDIEWIGIYQLKGSRIWDSAVRWTKDMYIGNDALQVLSFQIKKRVPIGKGGMILTDSEDAYKWLKFASYDGRNLKTPYEDENHVNMIGYHMYMTPEDAARGIILMDSVPEINEDSESYLNYTEIRDIIKNKFLNE